MHDLTGKRFGRWLVRELHSERDKDGKPMWQCVCDCGKTAIVRSSPLVRGKSQSCGCWAAEKSGLRLREHGQTKTRLFRIWSGMWNRCTNTNDKDYPRYGGRGIVVSERWRSFPLFLADMGQPPTDKHSIDRYPNQSGNYELTNCRWATATEQARNRRNNTLLTIDGETKTIVEWSEVSGVNQLRIAKRVRSGWGVREAVFTPPGKRPSRGELERYAAPIDPVPAPHTYVPQS